MVQSFPYTAFQPIVSAFIEQHQNDDIDEKLNHHKHNTLCCYTNEKSCCANCYDVDVDDMDSEEEYDDELCMIHLESTMMLLSLPLDDTFLFDGNDAIYKDEEEEDIIDVDDSFFQMTATNDNEEDDDDDFTPIPFDPLFCADYNCENDDCMMDSCDNTILPQKEDCNAAVVRSPVCCFTELQESDQRCSARVKRRISASSLINLADVDFSTDFF